MTRKVIAQKSVLNNLYLLSRETEKAFSPSMKKYTRKTTLKLRMELNRLSATALEELAVLLSDSQCALTRHNQKHGGC